MDEELPIAQCVPTATTRTCGTIGAQLLAVGTDLPPYPLVIRQLKLVGNRNASSTNRGRPVTGEGISQSRCPWTGHT